MFFEVFNWAEHKGEIGLATSDNGLRWKYQQIVLREPFHISYPQIIARDGVYYMIPERGAAGALYLYRAESFPFVWRPYARLLDGAIADATVFQHDGLWWLFACSDPEAHSTLRLYRAEALEGPWEEHPASPVVEGDPQRARPAGTVVRNGDGLIRLAQDCTPDYGTAVRAFTIDSLTASTYSESPCGEAPILGPGTDGWNACGMHHVDAHEIAEGQWLAYVDGWTKPNA
jgi:hypothetical protein